LVLNKTRIRLLTQQPEILTHLPNLMLQKEATCFLKFIQNMISTMISERKLKKSYLNLSLKELQELVQMDWKQNQDLKERKKERSKFKLKLILKKELFQKQILKKIPLAKVKSKSVRMNWIKKLIKICPPQFHFKKKI
jgi:hypothetical protein